MIRVRILQPTIARLALQPGDEIQQLRLTPELQAFLDARRVDGLPVAAIVDDDEVATVTPAETAIMRGRRTRVGAV